MINNAHNLEQIFTIFLQLNVLLFCPMIWFLFLSYASMICPHFCNTCCSRSCICHSNACRSWGTWNSSKQSKGRGFNRNRPFKVHTQDSTTCIQLAMNDQETTTSLSFGMPCSLCPVVASFIFIVNCVRLTPFNIFWSLTSLSRVTWTYAEDFTGESLKHCASFKIWSLFFIFSNSGNLPSSWSVANSSSYFLITYFLDTISSVSGNRSNSACST